VDTKSLKFHGLESSGHRRDIDGLRALAVISVAVGHYFPILIPQGFLGVDIFFVISGYVITQMMTRSNQTSFLGFLQEFYSKRIRRLIPALVLVVALTLLFSYLVMTRVELEIVNTGAFSLIGLSNIYLLHTSNDYFGLVASQNPFTHTWSLGVEEQFYAIYPIFFWLVTYKYRTYRLISFLTLILLFSLILALYFKTSNPNLVFYSMPTRLWELSLGAIAFCIKDRLVKLKHLGRLQVIAVLTILVILTKNESNIIFDQLLVSVATSFLVIPNTANITKLLSSQLSSWIGLRSYSIYLIHWPILVLGTYLFGKSAITLVLLLILMLFLSFLNYKYIENRFRYHAKSGNPKNIILISFFALVILAGSIRYTAPKIGYDSNVFIPRLLGIKDVPVWHRTECSMSDKFPSGIKQAEFCLAGSNKSQKPFIFLVGDSHADHLIPMVKRAFNSNSFTVKQVNIFDDIPFAFFKDRLPISLQYIRQNSKSNDLVVLAFHRGHLNEKRDSHIYLGDKVAVNPETSLLIKQLNEFALEMKGKGVKVVLVKDTPLMKTIQSSQSCALNMKFFKSQGCSISRKQDEHTRSRQSFAFDRITKLNSNVVSWDPFNVVYKYNDTFHVTDSLGEYLMWDWNHISERLSRLLAPDFKNKIQSFLNEPID
jgi:peptidoglycan/LPS O-acetylase OafA/YrhL